MFSSIILFDLVLDSLSEAIRKGDAKGIKTGVGNAIDALNRHIDIATTWANSIADPDQRQEALAKIQRLKELRDQVFIPFSIS